MNAQSFNEWQKHLQKEREQIRQKEKKEAIKRMQQIKNQLKK